MKINQTLIEYPYTWATI